MNRAKQRTDKEWMELITLCRQSGLSDSAWCINNGIPASSFYNAISRLRKKACDVPQKAESVQVMDLTASGQEVVPISIVPEQVKNTASASAHLMAQEHIENSYTIMIRFSETEVCLNNHADPDLAGQILNVLRRL